jgi:hypothetical protein
MPQNPFNLPTDTLRERDRRPVRLRDQRQDLDTAVLEHARDRHAASLDGDAFPPGPARKRDVHHGDRGINAIERDNAAQTAIRENAKLARASPTGVFDKFS